MSVLQNCKLAQVEVLNKTDEEAEKIALEYLDKVGLLEKKEHIRITCLVGKNSV